VNIGNTLSQIDRFAEADEMYERSRAMSEELGLDEVFVQASYNQAYLYYYAAGTARPFNPSANFASGTKSREAGAFMPCATSTRQRSTSSSNLSKDAAALAMRAADQFGALGFKYEQRKRLFSSAWP